MEAGGIWKKKKKKKKKKNVWSPYLMVTLYGI